MRELVWYVSYGSNMCRDRLLCYLQGGRPPGARRTYAGARDRTPPRDDAAVHLPGTVYFAGESPVWGGGVAFYDPDRPAPGAPTAARAYLLTVDQFVDVAAQEMNRQPTHHDPLEDVVRSGLPGGRYEAGPGAYETIVEVGRRGDAPMLTFTAPYGVDAVSHTIPSIAYRDTIARGLRESHHFDDTRVEAYFARLIRAEAAR